MSVTVGGRGGFRIYQYSRQVDGCFMIIIIDSNLYRFSFLYSAKFASTSGVAESTESHS
jgi:hypothetical protein